MYAGAGSSRTASVNTVVKVSRSVPCKTTRLQDGVTKWSITILPITLSPFQARGHPSFARPPTTTTPPSAWTDRLRQLWQQPSKNCAPLLPFSSKTPFRINSSYKCITAALHLVSRPSVSLAVFLTALARTSLPNVLKPRATTNLELPPGDPDPLFFVIRLPDCSTAPSAN